MKRWRGPDPQLAGALILAAVVFAYFSLRTPGYATVPNMYTVLQGFVFVGIAALAMGLTMIAGEFDLAIPSTAALAGIVAVQLAGQGIAASIMGALLVGLAIGLIQGISLWWLRINSLVFTLGSFITLSGVAFLVSGGATVVSPNLSLADTIQRHLFVFSPGSLTALALFVAVGWLLRGTYLGTEIRAIGGGRTEAISAGVPLLRPLLLVFVCSGVLASLLGALASLAVGSASARQFDELLLNAVTAALVGGVSLSGGRGSALGIGIGVLTLRLLNSGLSLQGAPYYVSSLATGILLMVVVTIEVSRGSPSTWQRFWPSRLRSPAPARQ